MPLTEITRRRWTGTNRHAVREYRSADGRYFVLDLTLDGVPPFFHLTERTDTHRLMPILVDGRAYWGDGWTWKRALNAAEQAITTNRKRGTV